MEVRGRAVIYIQPGTVPRDRQAIFCLEYCESHNLEVVGVVLPAGLKDAVEMTASGAADVVVTAFAGRSRPGDLRELAQAADVIVEYVRAPVVRREIRNMLEVMYRRSSGDVSVMARMLGESTDGLRRSLGRMGILNPQRWNGTAPDSRE